MSDSQQPSNQASLPPATPQGQSSLIAALSTPSAPSSENNFVSQQTPGGGPIRVQLQTPLRPPAAPYTPSGVAPPPLRQGGTPMNSSFPGQPIQQSPFPPAGTQVQQVIVRPPHPQLPPGHIQQQPSMPMHPQGPVVHLRVSDGAIIDKVKLDNIVKQVDSSAVLEDNVKDVLVEYMDEFVQDVVDKVCRLVQNRGNNKLETRDVELILSMVYKMPSFPRAAVHVHGAQPTAIPKLDGYPPTDAHKQRMMVIKKQLKKL